MNKKELNTLKVNIGLLGRAVNKFKNILYHGMGDYGPGNCDCCKEYFYDDCEGCPIMADTGKSGCANTPYQSWCDHTGLEHNNSKQREGPCCDKYLRTELAYLLKLIRKLKRKLRCWEGKAA